MESIYILVLVAALVMGLVVYYLLYRTKFARFALLIAVVATVATTASLLYSRHTVEPTLFGAASVFNSGNMELCETTMGENKCSQAVEYKGFPFSIVKITQDADGDKHYKLSGGRTGASRYGGGAGLITDFIVYAGVGMLAALPFVRKKQQ